MDSLAHEALQESLRHWQDNTAGVTRSIASQDCPLCILFLSEGCKGCPIFEHTKRQHCKGTPYWDTVTAYQELYKVELLKDEELYEDYEQLHFRKLMAWYAAAQEEARFLHNLLHPGKKNDK